jgi:hypothetical protein
MRLKVRSLRRVVQSDLRIEFMRQEVTSYAGLELLRRYVRKADVFRRLRDAFAAIPSDYGGARLALLVLVISTSAPAASSASATSRVTRSSRASPAWPHAHRTHRE